MELSSFVSSIASKLFMLSDFDGLLLLKVCLQYSLHGKHTLVGLSLDSILISSHFKSLAKLEARRVVPFAFKWRPLLFKS